MAKLKLNFAQFLKLLIAGILLVIVTVITVNFISYSNRRPEVKRIENEDPPEKTEKMERGKFFETKGGAAKLNVEFDELFVGEDGLNHAVGNVRALFKEKYEFLANEIVYDRDWTHFLLKGKAKIQYEATTLEGSSLEYDRTAEVFKTNENAVFSSERFSGFASEMIYFIEEERLELKDHVYLELATRLDSSSPMIVEGERFVYLRANRQGQMEGNVRFSQGKSHGSADFVEFELFLEEEQVRSVLLRGNVIGTLVENGERIIERYVQADEVKLLAFLDFPKIRTLEAEGDCLFKFLFPSGNSQQGESKSLKFVLSRQGRLREFHALGQAHLVDVEGETKEERIVEGESLVLVEAVEGLQIKGNDEYKASLYSKDYEISANEIILDTEKNNLEATEKVKVILKPGISENAMGFFSQEKSIFIAADKMRYFAEQERFLFTGGIKSWQEKEILLTDQLSIDRRTGKIECIGQVKSVFPYESKSSLDQGSVEIAANKMSYNPEGKSIIFSGACSLKTGEVKMTSQTIKILFKEGQTEMQKFLAEGKVIIAQQQSEGRGEEAQFDVENETIVLLGNPVLIDKDKGRTEGDKLTFFLADDRIVVENQGQERSFSVIKS
ncbi:MAG: LptA/OstA family protein [Candidatus Aminicenantes bacterium]|nr:LptA/OstA family protein [Candidatus Aminicenantes bacterium]